MTENSEEYERVSVPQSVAPLVYVSGPITGNPFGCVRESIPVFKWLIEIGCVPFMPQFTVIAEMIESLPYETYLAYDFGVIRHCQAVIRLRGVAPVAQRGGASVKYGTIVADPPWPFTWRAGAGGRRRRATTLGYPTMTVEAICALPVGSVAADDANLFLWVTRDLFREGVGVQVARAWGFEPKGEIIWRKPNFGTGHMPRPGHEPLLVCSRGAGTFQPPYNVHSVQDWKQNYGNNHGKKHSAKPDGALDLAERVSPGPYLELFSRRARFGWDTYGDESLGGVDLFGEAS